MRNLVSPKKSVCSPGTVKSPAVCGWLGVIDHYSLHKVMKCLEEAVSISRSQKQVGPHRARARQISLVFVPKVKLTTTSLC